MKRLLLRSSIFAAIAVTSVAHAADMPTKAKPLKPAPAIPGWTFSLTPYVWAPSITGSTTVKGRTTEVDASAIDILRHTEVPKQTWGLSAFGEARYDRFGLLTDILYARIGFDKSLSRSREFDNLGASVGASAGLNLQLFIGEFAGAYEIARWNGLTSPISNTAFDLYAGGRVWWLQADAQLAASGTLNIFDLAFSRAGVLSAKGDVSWFDPVVGGRLRHQFAPGWNLAVSGDVGGFGAGSKFSWQALATLDHEFCRCKDVVWSWMLGYKALFVNYSKGSGLTQFEFDNTLYGPVFGITARF